MQAGRELDRVIAERGMGWIICDKAEAIRVSNKAASVSPNFVSFDNWYTDDLYVLEPCAEWQTRSSGLDPLPHFSTDVESAFVLTEALIAKGYAVELLYLPRLKRWKCRFDSPTATASFWATAEDAATVIAQAAWYALGEEDAVPAHS